MSTTLVPRRPFEERLPVAAVLPFRVVPSWVATATGLRPAGAVMALSSVLVRGVRLARTRPAPPLATDVAGLLRENVRVLPGAGGWFLAALVAAVVEPFWRLAGLPGAFSSPADSLVLVLTGTGVAAVLLSAVAAGVARIEGRVALERDA